MTSLSLKVSLTALAMLMAAFCTTQIAQAHCDSLDGPVVNAARAALAEGNINLVLIWVQKDDETAIKKSYEHTLAVRQLNAEARELADMYFFETLVRIHRAGEGAPYTGLKASGTEFGPSIPASDKALATGDVDPTLRLLSDKTERGVREDFKKALAEQQFDKNKVQAGREFVKAYVEYTHYVKGIHARRRARLLATSPRPRRLPRPLIHTLAGCRADVREHGVVAINARLLRLKK